MATIKKGLITIQNKTADAYTEYLSNPLKSSDYHLAVKQESSLKLKLLKEKAEAIAETESSTNF
jgi:hypothetical protein